MLGNYTIWRVLRVFFDDPSPREGFTLRWISRQAGLSPPSVRLHLQELSREGGKGYPLITKSRGRSYPVYWPNRNSELFRFCKRMDMIFRIRESGLLDFLQEKCSPDCIILFGSAARGEDTAESDVDIFLASKERRFSMGKYEKALGRKISLHFSESLASLPKELRNNIINGIILEGYLKVF